MTGIVTSRPEAELTIRVYGPLGHLDIDVAIDTGYTGELVLPETTIHRLGLGPVTPSDGILADGTVVSFDTCWADVEWFGQARAVRVAFLGATPLLGMGLLAGHHLRIDVVPGGVVEVRPLPQVYVPP